MAGAPKRTSHVSTGSRFSRRFISVRKVLRIRAFKSSVRCSPLVATRAAVPIFVMKRMIRAGDLGSVSERVSRRISAQLASSESVKCRTQSRCSAIACGASILQPEIWQGVPMDPWYCPRHRLHPCAKIQYASRKCCEILHEALLPCLGPSEATKFKIYFKTI